MIILTVGTLYKSKSINLQSCETARKINNKMKLR